jgi:hypothetical protein
MVSRISLGGDRIMSHILALATAPPIAPTSRFSDDECIQKLAALIEHRDNTNLGEIVALIARLAVPIE